MKECTRVVVGRSGWERLEELFIAMLVPLLEHKAERLLIEQFWVECVGS